jgi:hypothetical protein
MGTLVCQHDLSHDKAEISMLVDLWLGVIGDAWKSVDSRWPASKQRMALIDGAHGLFIWASTAMRFINGQDPSRRLNTLLASAADDHVLLQPSTLLNRLYLTVLDVIPHEDLNDLNLFHRVVGGIVTLLKPQTLSVLGALLDDGRGQHQTCGVIQDVLSMLRSIIFLPDPQDDSLQPIRFMHPSFVNFLHSKEHSGIFYTNPPRCHAALVLNFLRLTMKHGKDNSGDPIAISYVTAYFRYHFDHALQDTTHNPDFLSEMKAIFENSGIMQELPKWYINPDESQEFWGYMITKLEVGSLHV